MYGVGQSSPQRRGLKVIIGVMVLVLMLGGLFFVFYALVLKKDAATPTPPAIAEATLQVESTATETAPPPANTTTAIPATSTATRTRPPTDTPEPTPTLRPPPDAITISVRARVNISEGLAINLRDQPTINGSTIITRLLAGANVDVVDGPQDAGDLRWWNVNSPEGQAGWVVEAYGGQTWLVPIGWTDQFPPLLALAPTDTPTPEPTAEPATAAPVVTPTATSTLAPTATPAITPTASAVLTPTATPEGGIPSPTVGGRARVTTRFQYINLRQGPGLGSETIGQLEDGTIVTILEGPEEIDGLQWWKVDDNEGNVGWAAERVAGEVLLVPTP